MDDIPKAGTAGRALLFECRQVIEEFINHFPIPVSAKNLRRVRNTVSQTCLSKTKRRENVHNAFKVRRPGLFAGKSILLIDDVLTTGVTASECARKLKEAGGGRVHLFVLAIADHGKQWRDWLPFNPEGMLLL